MFFHVFIHMILSCEYLPTIGTGITTLDVSMNFSEGLQHTVMEHQYLAKKKGQDLK